MTHYRMEDLPTHLEEEQKQILDLLMQIGDPEDDMTDEEFHRFMWEHASEELRAEWTWRREIVAEAKRRGVLVG